jgi:hypothetical protein
MRMKMFAALTVAVVLAVAGAAWAGVLTRTESCCAGGADCCFPGSPCCEDGGCCELGLGCCPDGSCCTGAKAAPVKVGARTDCCGLGLDCCSSGSSCCGGTKAQAGSQTGSPK